MDAAEEQQDAGVHEVRDTATMQGAPSCIGVVLPGAVDDYRIVLLSQRADAGFQAAAIAVATGHRAQTNGLED